MEKSGPYSPERRAFDTPYRLRRLNSVRGLWGMSDYGLDSVDQGATVGIEIEMSWPQAFPSMAKWDRPDIRPRQLAEDGPEYAEFSQEYDRNDCRLKPLLSQIERVIPRVGRDAYWEFSFLPTRDVSVLMAEVETLYEKNILHPGSAYATHLTLSGVEMIEMPMRY